VICMMTRRHTAARSCSGANARRVVASAGLVLALQQVRAPRSRRACTVRDPLGCRRIVGCAAHARAVHGLQTAWGDVATSELGRREHGLGGVSSV
jgi:hypothetical protein